MNNFQLRIKNALLPRCYPVFDFYGQGTLHARAANQYTFAELLAQRGQLLEQFINTLQNIIQSARRAH